MAVVTADASTFPVPKRRPIVFTAMRTIARQVPIALVLGLVVGIHIPSLQYYFFGDDFLVLGDIQSRSFPSYMGDVIALRDLTPNWRPLTMLVYWGEFKAFGFDATAWRIVNLSLHASTVLLLYVLVLSMTKKVFVASAAALIFGVSASAVHTVTYITAFPHIFSEFLLVGSLLAMHRYVAGDERRWWWYWLSFLAYVAAFLANEGGVVIGLVLLVYFTTDSLARRRDLLDYAIKVMPFVLAATMLVAGLAGCGCQGVDGGFYSVGWHIPRETWVYMARLAYPVGAIVKEPTAIEWIWGSGVAASAIFFFVRGPNIARFAAVGMIAGVMPYAPGKIWTASRYTYLSLPFFAVLVAVAAGWLHHQAIRFNRYAAHALAAAALFAVGGLYAWQTWEQTQPFLDDTDRWQLLADDLRSNYETLPEGSTLYVVDDEGVWTNPLWQPTWMTSIGHALYGKDVTLRAVSSADVQRLKDTTDGRVYLVELKEGHLHRLSPSTVAGAGGGPQD